MFIIQSLLTGMALTRRFFGRVVSLVETPVPYLLIEIWSFDPFAVILGIYHQSSL